MTNQCGDFLPPVLNTWTCMDSDNAEAGCEVTCMACHSDNGTPGEGPALAAGERFMRPMETRDGRDVHGRLHWLRAGHPAQVVRRVPRSAGYYELALCWNQRGGGITEEWFEHFDGSGVSVCDCGAGDNVCPFSPFLIYLYGWLTTCWLYAGWNYPPGGWTSFMDCTGVYTPERPMGIRVQGSGFDNIAIATTGTNEGRTASNFCTHNAAVSLWGYRESGACWSAEPGYFIAEFSLFDWLYVRNFGCTFEGTDTETAMRNALMAWIKDDTENARTIALDQLDSPRRDMGLGTNLNFALTRFGRGWPQEAPGPDFDALPVIAPLTGRLRRTGLPVTGHWVLRNAVIGMDLVLQRLDWTPGALDGFNPLARQSTYPCVAVRVVVHMGVRADVDAFNAENHQIVEEWKKEEDRPPPVSVQIENVDGPDPNTGAMPRVLDDVDVIDWSYLGEPVHVPQKVTWLGRKSWLTEPQTYDHHTHQSFTPDWLALLNGLHDIYIGALMSHPEFPPDHRKKIWSGELSVGFGT